MSEPDLSFFCAKPEETNRLFYTKPHEFRNNFQRDRDRILYSKEFRRLSGKTQIFVTGFDDHMRTRLTHTLEVAQIAETIALRLKLNSMLAIAIAYGHDIGHTPFGHIGERTLNYILNGCYNNKDNNDNNKYGQVKDDEKGFKHNLQGVRVATFLEELPVMEEDVSSHGLNLTRYTLWGIKAHTEAKYEKPCEYWSETKNMCCYKNCFKNCNGKLKVNVIVQSSHSSTS